MEVLLVNPNREQVPWPVIPVGLCTIASALAHAGHDVELCDLTFSRDPAADVRAALRRRPARVVGLGVRNLDNCNFERPVFFLPEIRDVVVRAIRETAPSARLVVGGAAVNVAPRDVLDYLEADLAVVGDGEEAMTELLDALEHGRAPSSVTGVVERGGARSALPILDTGRVGRGEPKSGRASVKSLENAVRSEAFRWVDVARYARRGTPYPIQTKRGCALKCSYCVYNNIEGHAYRLRRPADIADEIAEALEHGVHSFEFVDSTFNLPLSHARAVCEELARRAMPIVLSTMGLNPAGVTDDLIRAMKRAGFRSLMCTPESASEVTLETLQKGFKREAVIRAARALRAAEMPTWWFFLIGAPRETMDTVAETFAFCEEHVSKRDLVHFSTGIRVYQGTPLAEHCKKTGWFAEDDPLFEPSWYLSPELDLGQLAARLESAARAHPNWMTNAEMVVRPAMFTVMKQAFRAIGWNGPFWLHLPKLIGLATRVGARQRGLARASESLVRIGNAKHHQ